MTCALTESLPVDPALVEEAASLEPDAAEARHAELAEQVRRANRLYHEEDAPEISRRGVRPAVPAPGRARGGLSRACHARLPDAEGRRHARGRPVPRGPPPPADAVPVQRVQPRRAAGLRHPRAPRPGPRRRPGARGRADLRRGAQDRRPRDLPPVRARPVRRRRHPRRRQHRRGRDAQPAHDHGDPGPPAGARHARGAGRGVHAQGGVRADQRRARGAGAAAVREPAQQRRGLAAPEGPGRDRRAGSCRRGCTSWWRTRRPSTARAGRSIAWPPSASPSTPIARPGSTSRA